VPCSSHHLTAPAASTRSSIEALEDELSTLAAHLNAGNYRFLELLAEFDRRGGHVGWGIVSCAHWLQWKCGIGLVAAREKVRVARALSALPKISDALRRGVLSYCKVRALTRVATAENEDFLVQLGETGTVSHVAERASREACAAEPDASKQPYPARTADALGLLAETFIANGAAPLAAGDRHLVTVHIDERVPRDENRSTRSNNSSRSSGRTLLITISMRGPNLQNPQNARRTRCA